MICSVLPIFAVQQSDPVIHLLKFASCFVANTWSVVENVPCLLDKNVFSVRCTWFIVIFHYFLSDLISILSIIKSGVLNSATIIIYLCIAFFNYVSVALWILGLFCSIHIYNFHILMTWSSYQCIMFFVSCSCFSLRLFCLMLV